MKCDWWSSFFRIIEILFHLSQIESFLIYDLIIFITFAQKWWYLLFLPQSHSSCLCSFAMYKNINRNQSHPHLSYSCIVLSDWLSFSSVHHMIWFISIQFFYDMVMIIYDSLDVGRFRLGMRDNDSSVLYWIELRCRLRVDRLLVREMT